MAGSELSSFHDDGCGDTGCGCYTLAAHPINFPGGIPQFCDYGVYCLSAKISTDYGDELHTFRGLPWSQACMDPTNAKTASGNEIMNCETYDTCKVETWDDGSQSFASELGLHWHKTYSHEYGSDAAPNPSGWTYENNCWNDTCESVQSDAAVYPEEKQLFKGRMTQERSKGVSPGACTSDKSQSGLECCG